MRRIYLDHNGTTRVDPDVLEEMLPYLGERFGNPSSIHHFGQQARRALDRARRQVADLIGAEPAEIVFTSGGTEANNQAIRGVIELDGTDRRHVVTTAVEHQAVLEPCRFLEERGISVTYLPVDEHGMVAPESVAAAIRGDTALVSVMLANNEVGTIQPVREMAAITRERGVLLHTDAVQAAGKIPVDVRELGVDLLTLSGHKMHGPKGAGALYVRRGTILAPLVHGGAHERHMRAGTENVPSIVGLGKACEMAGRAMEADGSRMAALRDRLQQGLLESIPLVQVNGHPEQRLPNTLNMSFLATEGETLMMSLDLMGIAVSTGSACGSSSHEPSHVLAAMGRSAGQAHSSLRISLGRHSTPEEVDTTIEALVEVVARLRETSPTHAGLPGSPSATDLSRAKSAVG